MAFLTVYPWSHWGHAERMEMPSFFKHEEWLSGFLRLLYFILQNRLCHGKYWFVVLLTCQKEPSTLASFCPWCVMPSRSPGPQAGASTGSPDPQVVVCAKTFFISGDGSFSKIGVYRDVPSNPSNYSWPGGSAVAPWSVWASHEPNAAYRLHVWPLPVHSSSATGSHNMR